MWVVVVVVRLVVVASVVAIWANVQLPGATFQTRAVVAFEDGFVVVFMLARVCDSAVYVSRACVCIGVGRVRVLYVLVFPQNQPPHP